MSLHDGQITETGRIEVEITNDRYFPDSQRYKAKLVEGNGAVGCYGPTAEQAVADLDHHVKSISNLTLCKS